MKRMIWSAGVAVPGLLVLLCSQAAAQDVIPPVLKPPPAGADLQNLPYGTYIQVATGVGQVRYLSWDLNGHSGSLNFQYMMYLDHTWNGHDYRDANHVDRWVGGGGYTDAVAGFPRADNNGFEVNCWTPNHRFSIWWSGGSGSVGGIGFGINSTGGVIPTQQVPYDGRTPGQIADAPKISIGIPGPLGSEYGYMTFNQRNGSIGLSASGQISDTPGHALNPFGLELQYDENGVRRTVPVAIGADGRFNVNLSMAMGSGGSTGRPLLLYHRTAGDEVNVGYYGNGTEFTRRSEVKEFQYDSLRNKIGEYDKSHGRFRYPRSNGAVIGVRG